MSPEDLRRQGDVYEAASKAALARGDEREAEAAWNQAYVCRAAAAKLERLQSGLQRPRQVRTIGTMEAAQGRSTGAAVSEAKTKNPTLFQRVLQEHGTSLPEWASKQDDLSHNTAQSWVKRGKGGRQIPRRWAVKVATDFQCPDLLDPANWPRGIRD
jgi:hypothetical protein